MPGSWMQGCHEVTRDAAASSVEEATTAAAAVLLLQLHHRQSTDGRRRLTRGTLHPHPRVVAEREKERIMPETHVTRKAIPMVTLRTLSLLSSSPVESRSLIQITVADADVVPAAKAELRTRCATPSLALSLSLSRVISCLFTTSSPSSSSSCISHASKPFPVHQLRLLAWPDDCTSRFFVYTSRA